MKPIVNEKQLDYLLNHCSNDDLGESFEFYNNLFRNLFVNMYISDSGLLGNTKYIHEMSDEEFHEYNENLMHLLISGMDISNFFRS